MSSGKSRWRARLADFFGNAPAPAEFHGAGIYGVGARMIDRTVGLLDERTCDPAPPEIGGERKSHRTATDDEDWRFIPSSHAAAPSAAGSVYTMMRWERILAKRQEDETGDGKHDLIEHEGRQIAVPTIERIARDERPHASRTSEDLNIVP